MKHRLLSLLLVLPGTMSAQVKATRIGHAPLITVKTSASLAGNVNGPLSSVFSIGCNIPWDVITSTLPTTKGSSFALPTPIQSQAPGRSMNLVCSKSKRRPFTALSPIHLETTCIRVASPDIYIDNNSKKIILWAHGMWTDGKA